MLEDRSGEGLPPPSVSSTPHGNEAKAAVQ